MFHGSILFPNKFNILSNKVVRFFCLQQRVSLTEEPIWFFFTVKLLIGSNILYIFGGGYLDPPSSIWYFKYVNFVIAKWLIRIIFLQTRMNTPENYKCKNSFTYRAQFLFVNVSQSNFICSEATLQRGHLFIQYVSLWLKRHFIVWYLIFFCEDSCDE